MTDKAKRGRKSPGVKTAIKTLKLFADKRATLFHGQLDWRMVALQELIREKRQEAGEKGLPRDYLSFRAEANQAALHALQKAPPGERYLLLDRIDTLWRDIKRDINPEFERAVVRGDANWLWRMADAIEGKRKPSDAVRRGFDAKVSTLLFQAAILNAKGHRVVGRDIYEVLHKMDSPTDKKPTRVEVEGWFFENRERCIQEIRDLGKLIGLPLPSEQGKHPPTKRARIAPTLNLCSAIKRLQEALRT